MKNELKTRIALLDILGDHVVQVAYVHGIFDGKDDGPKIFVLQGCKFWNCHCNAGGFPLHVAYH